jgi:ketosteroid isomerase-like protein
MAPADDRCQAIGAKARRSVFYTRRASLTPDGAAQERGRNMNSRWLALLLAFGLPTAALADAVDATDVERWLAAYEKAWETRDAAQASALFTEDARYYESPYAEPFAGREGIEAYWAEVTANQRDVEFTSKVLSVEGSTGIAHWTARFTIEGPGVEVRLDGIFVLAFEDAGTVRELREWWMTPPEE